MRLEQLHYLDELDRTHSMNLASEILFVSQQNISKSIRNLEEELDVQLLNRSSKGISLTPAGKTVVAVARNIFEQLNNLDNDLEFYRLKKRFPIASSLQIAYMESAIDFETLTIVLNKFHISNPQVSISTHRYSLAQVIDLISNDLLDIGLIFYPFYSQRVSQFDAMDLIFEPIINLKYYICCSNTHPLTQNNNKLDIKELSIYPLAMVQEDNYISQDFYDYLATFNYTPSTIVTLDDTHLLYSFLENSPHIVHLGILSSNQVNTLQKKYSLSFLPLDLPTNNFNICFLYKQKHLNPIVLLFKQTILQYYKKP